MSNEFNTSGVAGEVVTQSTVSDKSKFAAALLCLFLGLLGIHRFYLGRYGTGVAILLINGLGWLTAFLIVGYFFVAIAVIWVVVDFIRIICNGLVDSNGKKLK